VNKIALFAFNGDLMCFVHVLLNALDMAGRGYEVKVILEGSATRLIPELDQKGGPLYDLYGRMTELGLLEGACRACAFKMGTLPDAKARGIPLLDDMEGHPSMAARQEQGYEIITF
jgi:hypothetical protein